MIAACGVVCVDERVCFHLNNEFRQTPNNDDNYIARRLIEQIEIRIYREVNFLDEKKEIESKKKFLYSVFCLIT